MSTPAERADAFVHGLLSTAEATKFERECAENPELQSALAQARRRLEVLQSLFPPTEANEALVQATLRRFDDRDRRKRRLRRRVYASLLAPLAAAAVIVALFHVKYETLSASPLSLEVYGQNSLMAGSDAALRVRLSNVKSLAPLAGIPVEITLGEPGSTQFVSLASFNTDALGNGQPTFHLPDWADGSYPLQVTAHTAGKPEVLKQGIHLKRSVKLMLTTDKPIYQPGQTIHIRALALQPPNLKPLENSEAVFTISDPRGNVIFRRAERTSRFGISSADCELANEIIDGAYKIHARVGDTESSLSVDVRKYVLPKIRLTITTDQAWYRPGQEVRATLQANYHHGEPVANAEWNFEAARQTFGNDVITRLSGQLDKEGKASFVFRLPDQNSGQPQRGIGDACWLSARVRDQAGQEQTRRTERKIARRAFSLSVIPESGLLVVGVPNTIYVYAQTPDGSPAKIRGMVKASDVETPIQTSDLGIAAFKTTPRSIAETFEFRLADEKGNRFNEMITLRSGEAPLDFLIRADKAVYNGGDTIHLTALAGGMQPVFVDFLKDDQMIRSEVIDVKDGRGELAFDLPPEMFGTLRLIAYRFNADGLPLRKSRVIYVRPVRQLVIAAKPDKSEYKPGDKAKFNFQLTDGKGHAVPGALSLAMVDEAVFDVVQQMPGLERTFFLLEQELLKPVGTIYPWESDAGPDPNQRVQFEQAVFARTAQIIDQPSLNGSTIKPLAPTSTYPVAQGPTPYSLSGSTYQQKVIETNQERTRGLDWIRVAWIVFGILLVIAGDAILWMSFRTSTLVTIHAVWLFAISFGVGIMLFMKLGARSNATFQAVGAAVGSFDGMGGNAQKSTPESMTPNYAQMGPQIRVREQFPETMLWQPQLITDDAGRASLDIDLADSITTWRLSAGAVSADGRLGALQTGVRVFQPFFVELTLPVALTRNDEIEIPAVVSNFLPKAQSVEVRLEKAPWFDLLGANSQKLELKPREVRAVSFRIKVRKVGKHQLQVTARSAELGDAVKRQIEIVPDGRRVEKIISGELSQAAQATLNLPSDAIEGSGKAIVRIYPSSFSQLVEGIDGIFRLPTGCFEQTSSSLYPNVMALSYLRQTGKNLPEVEAKARQYIHVGYQRLLGFEVPGGGFDWFGHSPANIGLTAYGLMEFRDMARVHDVDPNLIARTRKWLMLKRNADGSWPDDRRFEFTKTRSGLLSATAYTAWAVFDRGPISESRTTREYLLKHSPDSIDDPYVLALVCHALRAIDPKDDAAIPYLSRLASLMHTSADGKKTWWALPAGNRTSFYGSGSSGDVETTALAVLALLHAQREPQAVRGGLAWLVEHRGTGNWGSTQATILALKALMEGTGTANENTRREVEIALDNQVVEKLELPSDQAEVMKQVDLSAKLKPGSQKVSLRETTGSAPAFQIEFRYHVPGSKIPEPNSPLEIELTYDRERLSVGEALTATAKVTNRQARTAPMVMLDLPVPPGFVLETDDLEKMVNARQIERYQLTPRQIIVYLRSLEPSRPLTLRYRFKSSVPAVLTISAGRVYEYYDPAKEGKSAPARLTVTPRGQ